ncbi:PilN domain-containing protein [Altericista sp. CCNU0014]|uniref:PilN domain-containing protein n=1 Tax=Altericista sp. CCNU0014 TaxID=3082949 RepID=UPI00384FC953
MYQIDINLLNDRPELGTGTVIQGTFAGGGESKMPLFLGGALAGGLVGLVLLLLGGITLFNQQLASREQALQSDLDKLAPGLSKVDELQAKEKVILAETAALATIFNQIKPWSATLQDLRDRVPPTLRITKIEQTATAAPAPSPSPSPAAGGAAAPPAAPPPSSNLKVNGNTLNFSDINDFELTLRKSPFMKPDKTQLVMSQREAANAQTGVSLVQYELRTELSDVPASELLQVLNAKGASGLVSRIEVLKRQGVMKP